MKDAKEKLNYLKWLVDKKCEGPAVDRFQFCIGLSESHAGFYEDNEESEAEHLINATRISETAVMYSQANGLVRELTYLDLLLTYQTLTYSRLRELERSSTSYRVRRLVLRTQHIRKALRGGRKAL